MSAAVQALKHEFTTSITTRITPGEYIINFIAINHSVFKRPWKRSVSRLKGRAIH